MGNPDRLEGHPLMKVLVSDVIGNMSHALAMKDNILAECPSLKYDDPPEEDTTLFIQLGTIDQAVDFAVANNINIISRSTTGLSDYRNQSAGDRAWLANIGIVHAHASNSHLPYDQPSGLDVICAVGAGDATGSTCSYGPGLEFFTAHGNESNSTSHLAGIIAQLMIDHPTWNFHDARQALRQTASNYISTEGWNIDLLDESHDNGGFGLINKELASLVTILDPMPPTRIQLINETSLLSLAWRNSLQTSFLATTISAPTSEPARNSTPAPASTIYSGSGQSFDYEFTESQNIWLSFYSKGSYSFLEDFAVFYLELVAPEQEPDQPENTFLDKYAAFYILDDNTGILAHDLSLDQCHLSLLHEPFGSIPSWISLARGSSLYFDGIGSFLSNADPSWKSYFPLAISFWFNSQNENDFTFFDHGGQFCYRLQALPASNTLKFFLGQNSYRTWSPAIPIFDSTWHHLSLFIRGPHHSYIDQCTLYLDSILQSPVLTQGVGSAIFPILFRFGYSEWDDFFNGHLKLLLIQPDSPSPKDILNHYQFGKWLQD